MVQLWLAKEKKGNIVSLTGFLFLGHLHISVAVWNEVNLHLALVFLLKIFGHLAQILIRSSHDVVPGQHGNGACGGVKRWRCAQEDTCQTSRCGPSSRPEHTTSAHRGVQEGEMVVCLHICSLELMLKLLSLFESRESIQAHAPRHAWPRYSPM